MKLRLEYRLKSRPFSAFSAIDPCQTSFGINLLPYNQSVSTRIPSSSAHHSYLTKLHILQCGGRWEVANTPTAQVFMILPKGRWASPFGTRGLPLLNVYRLRCTRFLFLWCDGWSCGETLMDGRVRIELRRGADILRARVFSTFWPFLLWTTSQESSCGLTLISITLS